MGHDAASDFESFVWLYKVSAPKIKFNETDWKALITLKDDADVHFKEKTYTFRQFSVSNDINVALVESYGKRLVCIEHFTWPVEPTNQPKSSVKLWLTERQWQILHKLRPWVDVLHVQQTSRVSELRSLFDALAYTLNSTCGHELRRRYGDMKVLEDGLNGMNLAPLLYISETGVDVLRALHEMRMLNATQLRDHIKYNPQK